MEKNNRLSQIADSYIELVMSVADTLEERDSLNILLWKLPDLKLGSNYVLDDFRPRKENNSVLNLYVRHKSICRPIDKDFENNFLYSLCLCKTWGILEVKNVFILKYRCVISPKNPFRYITLPLTEEGVWQAYLLRQTYHLIGMRWHGGYEKRTFINTYEDIEKISGIDISDELREIIRKKWSHSLLPSVTLYRDYAYVTHCWFDGWKGFMQISWKVVFTMDKKHVRHFQMEDEKVVVECNCRKRY